MLPSGEAVATEVANGAEVGRFKTPGVEASVRFTPSGGGLFLLGRGAVTRAEFGGATTSRPLPAGLAYATVTDPECRYAAEVRSAAPKPAAPVGFVINVNPEPPLDLITWDLVRGVELRRIRLADEVGNAHPFFAPDGQRVLIHGDQWEVATGRKLGPFASWSPDGAFSPDGQRYAVGINGRMTVWDVSTPFSLLNLPLGVDGSYCVRWSPDGRRLAAATGTTALVWDMPAKAK